MKMNDKNYFDHDADIGIIGYGFSLEESFTDAAKALFSIMTDLTQIQRNITIDFEFEENDIELALVTYLNLLISKAQTKQLIFSHFELYKNNNKWYACSQGEKWNKQISRGIDVKGATLTMLSVNENNGEWQSRCVVDV